MLTKASSSSRNSAPSVPIGASEQDDPCTTTVTVRMESLEAPVVIDMENAYNRLTAEVAPNGYPVVANLNRRTTLSIETPVFLVDSPNDLTPITLRQKSKDHVLGMLIDDYFTIYKNGIMVLDHHGYITHSVRKVLNHCLPKEIRVIMRDGKFLILDEQGTKHPFDGKVMIIQGKVEAITD